MNGYLVIITLCLMAIMIFFLAGAVYYLHNTELALKEVVKEINALRIRS